MENAFTFDSVPTFIDGLICARITKCDVHFKFYTTSPLQGNQWQIVIHSDNVITVSDIHGLDNLAKV